MLTSAQKAQTKLYLGRSNAFSAELDDKIAAAETSEDVVDLISDMLTQLASIDTKLLDAHGRLQAIAVGSISLPIQAELASLRSEGRRYVNRLASILGTYINLDVFSAPALSKDNSMMVG